MTSISVRIDMKREEASGSLHLRDSMVLCMRRGCSLLTVGDGRTFERALADGQDRTTFDDLSMMLRFEGELM